MLPAEAAAARNTAKARAVLRKHKPVVEPWFPPVEFSALVGLCIALIISGLSSAFLCKPVMLSHCLVGQGRHRVMKECSSCCASPAAQANHLVLMQRQPQRVLQPLPLPLRQYLELDQVSRMDWLGARLCTVCVACMVWEVACGALTLGQRS